MNSRLLRLSTARGSGTDLMTVGPAKVKACKSVILCVLVSVFKEFALSFFLFFSIFIYFHNFLGTSALGKISHSHSFCSKKTHFLFLRPSQSCTQGSRPSLPTQATALTEGTSEV